MRNCGTDVWGTDAWRIDGLQPSAWERVASGLAALGTFAFFAAAVGYGWYSLLTAMAA